MSLFPQKIVGIDFHDYSAQLIELRLKGNEVSLQSYSRVVIPSDIIIGGQIKKEDELKAILSRLLTEANPKPIDVKNVAIIFPASKTFTHIFKLPINLDEDEIRKALPYEAETVIPFTIDEVYWDFSILYKDSKEQKHASQYILFAAITKDVADQYARLVESIGLIPFLLGSNAEALKHALLNEVEPRGTSLMIQFGTLSTNYLLVKDKVVQYFFSSNDGGKKLMEDLVKELQGDESGWMEKKEQNRLDTMTEPVVKNFLETRYKQAQKIIQEQE
ncbi:MAG: pilus assembly protein PilM, partial [Candidatus Peregrinibacteria bacterium]|nr:pilus assembly protein PilM [Candidatus Peregrinibacteria bacterium]